MTFHFISRAHSRISLYLVFVRSIRILPPLKMLKLVVRLAAPALDGVLAVATTLELPPYFAGFSSQEVAAVWHCRLFLLSLSSLSLLLMIVMDLDAAVVVVFYYWLPDR